jgi:hypothetical protein
VFNVDAIIDKDISEWAAVFSWDSVGSAATNIFTWIGSLWMCSKSFDSVDKISSSFFGGVMDSGIAKETQKLAQKHVIDRGTSIAMAGAGLGIAGAQTLGHGLGQRLGGLGRAGLSRLAALGRTPAQPAVQQSQTTPPVQPRRINPALQKRLEDKRLADYGGEKAVEAKFNQARADVDDKRLTRRYEKAQNRKGGSMFDELNKGTAAHEKRTGDKRLADYGGEKAVEEKFNQTRAEVDDKRQARRYEKAQTRQGSSMFDGLNKGTEAHEKRTGDKRLADYGGEKAVKDKFNQTRAEVQNKRLVRRLEKSKNRKGGASDETNGGGKK